MPYKRIARSKYGLLITIISSCVLALLIVGAFIFFIRDVRIAQDKTIVEHLDQLTLIFKRIHETAHIVDFEHEQNYIDFLNVKCFSGSSVGSMHLMYPEKWEGPYVESNLEIQGKPYLLLKTRKGYWITPGIGVRLSSGKIIGKDIKINYDTDFEALTAPGQVLSFKNHSLAIPVPVQTNYEEVEP